MSHVWTAALNPRGRTVEQYDISRGVKSVHLERITALLVPAQCCTNVSNYVELHELLYGPHRPYCMVHFYALFVSVHGYAMVMLARQGV